MTEMIQQKLPYQQEPLYLFEKIRQLPWAQLLDSSGHEGELGRFDIICADPSLKILTQGQTTTVSDRQNLIEENNKETAFDIIARYLGPTADHEADIPFCGGAMGYFGYDLITDSLPSTIDERPATTSMPDLAVGIYDWAIVTDHYSQSTYFVSQQRDAFSTESLQLILASLEIKHHATSATAPLSTDKLSISAHENIYQRKFQRIQEYLLEGDCYQINYARCFQAEAQGSSWDSYCQLRKNNPVPFAAFQHFPFGDIISASPERFIKVTEGQVESRPIKGTRPRVANPEKDAQLKTELENSSKDRAENLMIVDLLRNDLGKSCVTGSIEVPELFKVETYPTVFHLVSAISGKLRKDRNSLQLLQDCFPGGSVTGAPKKRAMEIIAELEPYKRGIYCGAIGYVSFNGNMDTNIAIRTMTVSDGQLTFWAGGGIVADSDASHEFQETRDKAKAFLDLLDIEEEY